MYCMFCGKEDKYGVCETCSKDEAKINAGLKELNQQPWIGKSISREYPGSEGLYFLPREAQVMTLELLEKEAKAGAKECMSFGIYAVFRYPEHGGRALAACSERISPSSLSLHQKKMLFLMVAKHFEEMAELDK